MAYERFDREALILRDELAIDRTLLANERTLLAYLRSAVALIIAGVSIINISRTGWFVNFGIILIPVGFSFGLIGTGRFLGMRKRINAIRGGIIPAGSR